MAWLKEFIVGLLFRIACPRLRVSRSGKWRAVRAAWLAAHPTCAACGRKDSLTVHHIVPVHRDPRCELLPANLITLCEHGSGGCHLFVGHLGNWSSWNVNVVLDAAWWLKKVRTRP